MPIEESPGRAEGANHAARGGAKPRRPGRRAWPANDPGRPAKVSAILPIHGVSFGEVLDGARAAEAAGLDGVWVPDNLLNETHPPAGVLECWTVLSAIAGATTRIPVGTLVLTTAFRRPSLLAKQAATLDAVAPGRVVLGLGAGGFTYEEACHAYGYETLSAADRVAHVEETIACLRALWSDDPAEFHGRFASTGEVRIWPRPERPIPIVIAARRPRMLALTARVADGWNCPLPHELEAGLESLERAGRARDSIEVSVFAVAVLGESDADARAALERAGPNAQLFGDVEKHHVFGPPERAAQRIGSLIERGADHVTLDLRGRPPAESVELLARAVLPLLGADAP